MPSLIEGDDRQTVKRTVPKASNKIHAVAVVKLYVAYPDRQRWTYTGLQGAAVLANDLVGNTFWIKLVDISQAQRGVIWDQEIYDTFSYNQDRVFFHSFELEKCMAGFSFADDKEARKFKQKMDEREKGAHKNTKSRPFANAPGQVSSTAATTGKSHGILGGFGNLLHRDRHPSGQQQMQSIIPPQQVAVNSPAPAKDNSFNDIDPGVLDELLAMGITEDQLAENADFIRMYLQQKGATASANEPRKQRHPPPAPPSISPQDTGNSNIRGPPPAPPQSRQGATPTPSSPRATSPSPSAEPASPPGAAKRWNFRAPPPLEGAGKFASDAKRPPSPRASRSVSAQSGPPPPPRPPKTPLEDGDQNAPKFGVPPPFEGARASAPPLPPPRGSQAPPAPPPRGGAGPPPPPRESNSHAVPPAFAVPPPLPPKSPDVPSSGPPPLPPSRTPRAPVVPSRGVPTSPPPPTLPSRDSHSPVPPPPPPPARNEPRTVPPPPMPASSGPPPPPMPSSSGPPPPPPPMPSGSAAPPPPPMPAGTSGQAATANAPPLPTSTGGRDNLMADIRGGSRLKKVSAAEKNDRSAALVPGGESAAPAASSGGGASAGGDQGGLAGALASALAARKSKVSQSDDEDDKEDW